MTQDQASDEVVLEPPARAVVVAVDAARLALYAATLRMAEVPTRATLDVDEAESFVRAVEPAVLVLDHGLPRMTVFRLYGMVRGATSGPRVKVLFVGQEGETIPDDLYLPGEPSPLAVAAQVSELVAEADAQAQAAAHPAPMPPTAEHQAVAERADVESDMSAPPAGTVPHLDESEGREPELAGVAAPAVSPERAEPPPDQPRPGDRRVGVWMFRLGMLLLIIGGLLAFIRPETFSLPMMAPPVSAPATPTPAPSPSPAARADASGLIRLARSDDIRAGIVADRCRAPRILGISDVPGSSAT
ncbi:MAG: hypothetical protein AB7K36_29470 [Chloroflexota bacterium]